jgi:hypothetical protein
MAMYTARNAAAVSEGIEGVANLVGPHVSCSVARTARRCGPTGGLWVARCSGGTMRLRC